MQNGKSFAIIQAWCGGYGYGSSVASCVSNAWAAGMAHVDVYAFLCPNCDGNVPCSGAIQKIHDNLANEGVQFGMVPSLGPRYLGWSWSLPLSASASLDVGLNVRRGWIGVAVRGSCGLTWSNATAAGTTPLRTWSSSRAV